MILTGKALIDYDNWLRGNHYGYYLSAHGLNPDSCNYALMINWLDGIGIHVAIDPHIGGGADVYYAKVIYRDSNFIDTLEDVENTDYNPNELYFITRHEATKQAILKANQIYNER